MMSWEAIGPAAEGGENKEGAGGVGPPLGLIRRCSLSRGRFSSERTHVSWFSSAFQFSTKVSWLVFFPI